MSTITYHGDFNAELDGARYRYSLRVHTDVAIPPAKFDWITQHPVAGTQEEIADSLHNYFGATTHIEVGVDYNGESMTTERP